MDFDKVKVEAIEERASLFIHNKSESFSRNVELKFKMEF